MWCPSLPPSLFICALGVWLGRSGCVLIAQCVIHYNTKALSPCRLHETQVLQVGTKSLSWGVPGEKHGTILTDDKDKTRT